MLLNIIIQTQQVLHAFQLVGRQFYLDQEPFQIRAGEIHPTRVPHEYWRHRIQMARAMGLNTISLYIFWNNHLQEENIFDFGEVEQQNNISRFIELCSEENMWVLLRPGPYVCAEFDYGGIPPSLLKNFQTQLRTLNDVNFREAMSFYIEEVSRQFRGQMIYNGGNILMVQIENEYSLSKNQDPSYIELLVVIYTKNGISGPFYSADPIDDISNIVRLPGMAIGVNGHAPNQAELDIAQSLDKNVPVFVSELWTGWYSRWGGDTFEDMAPNLTDTIQFYMENNISFSCYVVHGGTNFGFTAANLMLTSYDYGAPISENGNPQNYYFEYRNIIARFLKESLLDLPEQIPTMSIPPILLKRVSSMFDQPFIAEEPTQYPKFMEHFNQNQGMMLYKSKLPTGKSGYLQVDWLTEFSHILVNGQLVGWIWANGDKSVWIDTIEEPGDLEILLEGWGHGFTANDDDRKGIVGNITFADGIITNFRHYRYPMRKNFTQLLNRTDGYPERKNGIYVGEFELIQPQDTFLDFGQLERGYMFVNGHHLGQYWTEGGQWRLYCPGVWLNVGKNEVIVVEMTKNDSEMIIEGFEVLY